MPKHKPGDEILCHLKNNAIVNIYEEKYDDTAIFAIVSNYEEGYIIYIPSFFVIKDTFLLHSGNYKKYGADKKFIDSNVCHITDYKVIKIHSKMDGLCCMKCKDFVPMASSNQSDEKSFLCWTCRTYKYR